MRSKIALLLALMLCLSSCTGGEAQTVPSGQEDDEAQAIVTYEPYSDGVVPGNFFFTVIAGEERLWLNGEELALTTAPVVQDRSLYLPLEDLTRILGGSYARRDGEITLELFDRTFVFHLEVPEIEIDGALCRLKELPGAVYSFEPGSTSPKMNAEDGYGPILIGETVFLPNGMLEFLFGALSYSWSYYDTGMLLFGRKQEDERGLEGVRLYDEYASLPEEVRAQYEYVGVVDQIEFFSVLKYQNDAAAIYVAQVKEGEVDSIDGRVCAIYVYGRGVPTPRGLQVGDSAYRAWLLYGYDGLTNSLDYRISSGGVSGYVFCTNYYGHNLLGVK